MVANSGSFDGLVVGRSNDVNGLYYQEDKKHIRH